MTVLVGDVGGTNCRLGLASRNGGSGFRVDDVKRYVVREHAGIEECIADYLDGIDATPDTIGIAAAGPKFDNAIRMTNISWFMSEPELIKRFGFEKALVVNDFYGMAAGATVMPADAFTPLIPGEIDWAAPVTVLGPGTGMGVALIAPGQQIIGTEGGHVSFSPETDREMAILQILWRQRTYISWENLVSGPGLMQIYAALCDIKGEATVIADPPALTQAAGLSGTPREAVMVFCGMLGAFAGNTALLHGASGGVIIAGGVARHVAPFFGASDFAKRFRARGSGSWYVEHIPVTHMHAHSVALHGVASLLL